ncbi:MAG TPA: HDOD domain-containing protein [Planctomycetes bacterium]|nr:HDOD domain-containing protein [Fuerstiella sp.]HIK96105.1 HDOD domain-containing protein [Planctomycetota bacterium]
MESIQSVSIPSDIKIPTLPQSVAEFSQRAADPDVELRDLAAIIETSTGLTVELLRYVNSARLRTAKPIGDVATAIARVGIRNTATYLIAAGIKSANHALGSKLIHHGRAWSESLQKALFAQAAARTLHLDTGLAFLGGLLQDFMLPALTNRFDNEYVWFLENDAKDGRVMSEWEQATFGWNHASTGAFIASQWGLPDDMLCAIYYHHSLHESLSRPEIEMFKLFPVTLSGLLPAQLRQCGRGVSELIKVDGRCAAIDLDELCRIVDDEQLSLAGGFDIPDQLSSIVHEVRQATAG